MKFFKEKVTINVRFMHLFYNLECGLFPKKYFDLKNI